MLVIIITGIMILVEPATAQRKKNRRTESVPAIQNIVLADKALSTYRIT
jgi:hypothetical protein